MSAAEFEKRHPGSIGKINQVLQSPEGKETVDRLDREHEKVLRGNIDTLLEKGWSNPNDAGVTNPALV